MHNNTSRISRRKKHVITVRMPTGLVMGLRITFWVVFIAMIVLIVLLTNERKKNQELIKALVEINPSFEGKSTEEMEEIIAGIKKERADSRNKMATMLTQMDNTAGDNAELIFQLADMIEGVDELDQENDKLLSENKALYDEIKALRARKELFDKFEYTLYDPDTGKRTDITFSRLITGKEIMERNGLDPNLLFGIIMTETRGQEKLTSSAGAKGLGQVMDGTGRYIWNEYMGKGNFKPEMLYDGDINIQIAANYLVYLSKKNTSVYGIIDNYAGGHDPSYYAKVNRFLSFGGHNLDEINKNSYN